MTKIDGNLEHTDSAAVVRAGRTGTLQPLGMDGVARRADGVLKYTNCAASLVEMLRGTVDRHPDNEALVEIGGRRLSYRELWDEAATVAGGLRAAGVTPGDRVAIRYSNGIRWCLAFFGAQLAGAVVVPVNTRFAEPEVAYVLEDSQASYVFEPQAELPAGRPFVFDAAQPETLAGLFYTSGTTGFPKGAMTSHSNFLATSETFQRQAGRPGPDVRNLVSVPLFHVTGCNSQLLPTVEIGGTTVILPEFNVPAFMDAIARERVNLLVAVPSIYWLTMQRPEFATLDVSAIRLVGYGGAPMSPELVRQMIDAFPQARLVNGYGHHRQPQPRRVCRTSTATSGPSRSVWRCPSSSSIFWTQMPVRALASCSFAVRTSHRGTGASRRRLPQRSSTGGFTLATWRASTLKASWCWSTGRKT